MFAASKTDSVSGGPPDAQFNQVTMLLHGDGTNGAQNNTFLDSSTNAFSITRNGNTTQGSFSPYGSNWGNAFTSASGDYLSVPYSSAFNLTGDFTVECWINPSALPTSNGSGSPLYARIFSFGTYNAANSIGLELNSNDAGRLNAITVWYNGSQYYSANSLVAVGNWYHCAMVRSGTTITIYLNGTSVITITGASAAVNTSQALLIATLHSFTTDANACFKGSISNFRVVKGTAVYTSTFTPPTTPLTAITNTVLLTCQSNRFVDNSTTAATITSFGTTSVQRFNPFGTSTAYSTSVIGGSGYFDGTGDWLSVASATPFDFGSGDFTLECWAWFNNFSSDYRLIAKVANISSFGSWQIIVDTSGYPLIYASSAATSWNVCNGVGGGIAIKANCWNHIAATRSGNTFTMWVNGVSSGTTTSALSIYYSASVPVTVGGMPDGTRILPGYITDARVVKGTAVYTSAFTPPTAPLSAITNTSLLTNMTNGAIFDNAMMNDLETVGNAQISTSVKKYGTGSLSFNGTGRLVSPPTYLFDLAGNFTIECWVNFNTLAGAYTGIASYADSSGWNGWQLLKTSSNIFFQLLTASGGTGNITSNVTSLNTGVWYHIAVVRSGSTITLYIDGVSNGTSTTTASYSSANSFFRVGDERTLSYPLDGYVDDLRITKGFARYTAAFTPPTAAFSDTGPY
jgi:hypothetical protein